MKKYIQNEFLKISHFKAKEWQHPVHNHNHFEIIFVHSGEGTHCLSGIKYPYTANQLFLLAPSDFHHFEIRKETTFTFIKFTNMYFKSFDNSEVLTGNIETLFIQSGKQNLPLIKSKADAEKIASLVTLIADEWKETKIESKAAIYFMLNTVISIVKRNLEIFTLVPERVNAKITAVLNYVHQHIFSTELIQAEHLAAAFGYSKYYIGVFFKNEVGISLRDYVNQYRLQLIKFRLKSGSYSIKEISNQFGFTDLSHFNKFFRTHATITPSEFRKQSL
jgi:YesN/AraC family two-component response regulator